MEHARQRFIRFGIRSLLVLTLIAAVPLAWLAAKRSAWVEEESAIQAMSPHVSHVRRTYSGPNWLYRIGVRPNFLYRVDHLDFAGYSKPGAVWRHTDSVHKLDDDLLAELTPHLLQLAYLRELHLETTQITDASSPIVARFGHLRFLNIQDNDFSDETVRDLMHSMPNTTIAFFFCNERSIR